MGIRTGYGNTRGRAMCIATTMREFPLYSSSGTGKTSVRWMEKLARESNVSTTSLVTKTFYPR